MDAALSTRDEPEAGPVLAHNLGWAYFVSGLMAAEQSFRLPKALRIRRSAEYGVVTSSKRSLSDRFFVVCFKRTQQTDSRLGVTVSRRVSAKAVDRNRIKRVVRESFRLHRPHLTELDVVAIAKRPAKNANQHQLRSSLEQHWHNLSKDETCAKQ